MSLVTLLLNYFAGLDLERRDQRGLTALMKAAIQDRSECVVALLMAGVQWQVCNGRCTMPYVLCQVCYGRCAVAGVLCQVCAGRCVLASML